LYFPFIFVLPLYIEQPSSARPLRLSLCISRSAPLLRHLLFHRWTTSTRVGASSSSWFSERAAKKKVLLVLVLA
jgi:hypothetical protein